MCLFYQATYWVEVWPVAEGQVTFYVSSLPKAEETTLDMLQTGFVYNRFRGDCKYMLFNV